MENVISSYELNVHIDQKKKMATDKGNLSHNCTLTSAQLLLVEAAMVYAQYCIVSCGQPTHTPRQGTQNNSVHSLMQFFL